MNAHAPFKPQLILKSQLRCYWPSVLLNSAWSGPAGLTYQLDDDGTQRVDYRDDDGRLRGVLVLYGPRCEHELPGQLLLMVDPEIQRRGIGTELLLEAWRRGMEIDFTTQAYTRPGWRAVRRFLALFDRQQDRKAA